MRFGVSNIVGSKDEDRWFACLDHPCPNTDGIESIASFGILGGIIFIIFYIRIILHDAGKVDVSDGIKSIGLSYIQITTLLSTFPILWPDIFISIFRVGGAVTAMGKHTFDLKCMFPVNTEADVTLRRKGQASCVVQRNIAEHGSIQKASRSMIRKYS